MRFADVIGQEKVKRHLLCMVQSGQLPHALMFCGPQGVGKLPLALAFARYLLCEHPSADEACHQCNGCRMTDNWTHPDLHFSFPVYKRKSTDRPVSDDFLTQWREQLCASPYFDIETWLSDIKAENQQIVHYVFESDALQRKLALKSNQGGRKVVILWLPERMLVEMANKLLKLIEEPPLGTYFLLVTEDAENVLGTIQSRVQCVQVPALGAQEMARALMQNHGVEQAQAEMLARVAQGNYIKAQKMLANEDEERQFFDLFVQLMRKCYLRDIREMRKWADSAADLGRERQKRMLAFFQHMLRENFIFNLRQPLLNYQTPEENRFSTNFARFINERNVITIMEELSDAQRDIGQNVNARMVFFDLALKMAVQIKQ